MEKNVKKLSTLFCIIALDLKPSLFHNAQHNEVMSNVDSPSDVVKKVNGSCALAQYKQA